MQLLIVFLVFLATSLASAFLLSKRSDRFWEATEYILLSVALVGIAAAVADITASRKQQAISDAAAASLSAKSSLNYRTEWVMNSCGVWWDDVLNQTNDTPPACFQTHPTPATTGSRSRTPLVNVKEPLLASHLIPARTRLIYPITLFSSPSFSDAFVCSASGAK